MTKTKTQPRLEQEMNLLPFELSDEHLAQEISEFEKMTATLGRTGIHTQRVLAWLSELQRRRAAKPLNKEQVREVVLAALHRASAIARLGSWGCLEETNDVIADRVAEQLAVPTDVSAVRQAPVQLNEEERKIMAAVRDVLLQHDDGSLWSRMHTLLRPSAQNRVM